MIVLCSGEISERHFDAMVLMAQQLDARGHAVCIDQSFAPEVVTRQITYEMAPYLTDATALSPACLIVVGAQHLSPQAQERLSHLRIKGDVAVWAVGSFETLQDEITARSRIAYATGREPEIVNLTQKKDHLTAAAPFAPLLTEIQKDAAQNADAPARVLVYVPYEDGDDAEETLSALGHLSVLQYNPQFELHILTNSKGKELINRTRPSQNSVFSYLELPPLSLLNYFDILVFLGPDLPGQRMAVLVVNALGAGKVVIDCTAAGAFSTGDAPTLRGPTDPQALTGYLRDAIDKNREEIGSRIVRSTWLTGFDIAAFEQTLGLSPAEMSPPPRDPQRLIFPTNGNGLGHAQRCALVADEIRPPQKQVFAAFPSCVTFLRKRGYECVPMVPRSAEHKEEHAADILNYLRLRQVLRRDDQVVFDGGFVFDSVYRLVSALDLSATWIRRGLWKPGQINSTALERERAFKTVIVPSEAFEELNTDYSDGPHIHKVGPIVQTNDWSAADTQSLRDRLSVEFDREIDLLMVSMLGGGVASRRTAHTQLLSSLAEQRPNTLHLILAWPNAVVDSALFGWENSFVVHTNHAMDLCRAADFCVSAAGYNSFHELLYAKVPTLFVPQAAPYLDDQEQRARAAAERQLCVFAGTDALFKLEREARACMDGGKCDDLRSALDKVTLPPPGNSDAARIIEKG